MKNKCLLKLISFPFFLFLFCQQTSAQQNKGIIDAQLLAERDRYGLSISDINQYQISSRHFDSKSGLTYNYIQQIINNIPVFNAISVMIIKDNLVVYSKLGMVKNIAEKAKNVIPVITPEAAINKALSHLGINSNPSINAISTPNSIVGNLTYDLSAISASPVRVQLVYLANEKGVYLAWDVSIEMKNLPNWWNIRIDALNGRFLDKNDWNVSCNFDSNGNHQHKNKVAPNTLKASNNATISPPLLSPASGQYNVFALPIEAPTFGSRSLLANPHDVTASPYGWHDTNGVDGAEYTITRGNNVFTYSDDDNINLPGDSPDGMAGLNFDFPFLNAIGNPAAANKDASATNLFYVNNRLHDVLYHHGFNEQMGNFQQKNYTNEGYGSDAVNAESFDGSGTNNANFSTPPDGFNPRMQMFLWTSPNNCASLNITSVGFNGTMSFGNADFSAIGGFNAPVVLVNDGVGTTSDGCSTIPTDLTGKIALIDRGNCTFVLKAQNAIAKGAIGVIIANNVAGAATGMTGTPVLSVPVISVSQTDGNLLKSQLLLGIVTANFTGNCTATFDGAFDNGIIAHEYGHGVSTRLTGGAFNSSCLINTETGSEGWSDWLGLLMTTKATDVPSILTQARGVGTYVQGQPTTGPGIRRFRYSVNMAINPQTYANVAASTEVHNVGEIWCSAIWDLTSFLINDFGFNIDPTNTTSGNNIAMKLVLEGMKLQPCSPGFLDSRDAILQADALFYNNAHKCRIWEAFARRGMGINALQGSSASATDQTAGFNMPTYCTTPPSQSPSAAFNSSSSTVQCGNSIQFTDTSTQPFSWLWEFGDGDTSNLQNPSHQYNIPGAYNVKLTVTNTLGFNDVTHSITVGPAFTATVTATPNPVSCGSPVQLTAAGAGSGNSTYTVNSIPYAPISANFIVVPLGDDQVSGALPIGFNFNFYGQDYSNFYISSNGFITFSANQPVSPFANPIPLASSPNNLIALAWNDLDPSILGGSIGYFVSGIAPNRKLIVQYNVNHYGTNITNIVYPYFVQAILLEGTNEIEIHTTAITDATSYDPASATTQGVENANGTQGTAIPNRNYTTFTANEEGFKFTPSIKYNYKWVESGAINAAQVLNPISNKTYDVKVSDGSGCVQTFTSPLVTVTPFVATITGNKPFCQGSSIVLDAGIHGAYLWSTGEVTQTITVSTASIFSVSVTDQNTCSGTGSVTTTLKSFIDCCTSNPTVTNTNNSGPGSLRDAVIRACPGSTITFSLDVTAVNQTIKLIEGKIIIGKNLTIQGIGSSKLAIQNTAPAGANSYVFHVNGGVNATITDLTITGGNVNASFVGGGITNLGTLTLSKIIVTSNTSKHGGGILNSGNLIVNKTTIDGNTSQFTGGGLENISLSTPVASATIRNSTISANNSSSGAGIHNQGGNLILENSTIANNISNGINPTGGAGGLENVASGNIANAMLTNVTFNGNQHSNSSNTTADDMYSGNFGFQSIVNLKNTILGGSSATASPNVRVYTNGTIPALGVITSLGHNLSSDNGIGEFIANGDLLNQDLRLGTFTNNGGDTKTFALLIGSPAINGGTCEFTNDQRGAPRIDNGACDSGAFESNGPLPVNLISFSVKKQENNNLLQWKVATETAPIGYEIQKSDDGKMFVKIGFVKGIEETNYQYLDKNTNLNGKNSFLPLISYYRLKLLENDDKFIYSKIVSIENEIESATVGNFYPNPPTDKYIFIDITVNQADIWSTYLASANGTLQKIKNISLKKGTNKMPFEINYLPKGVYLMKFLNSLKEEVVRKFIVE